MPPDCTLVFLPCHSLDDFPTWLDEAEADDLLSAWTAAWHPALIASVGGPPRRASVDLPPPAGSILGIVPATWDDRFAAQFDAARPAGSSFVRRKSGVDEITRAAAAAVGGGTCDSAPLPGEAHAADFHALGLAALLAELLARRMRSHAELESTGFPAAVATAARAAVDGRDADCRTALRECFDCLAATRHRYYPVDSWLVDLVLVAESAHPEDLAAALDSPVPLAVVATGGTIESLARRRPEAVRLLREAAASGRVGLCGGRDVDRPLDACTPEEILDSFRRGRDAWRDHVGAVPDAFARIGGGGSAILPQVLAGLGCSAGVWSPFDGSSLPDVGGGLIHWSAGGASIDMVASPPLDARAARTVLALHDTLGDALDREHVAALLFAHHAGTGGRWHGLLRRIGGWTDLLGTFVTPAELVRRTGGAGTRVALEPDAFPPTLPATLSGSPATADDIAAAIAAARAEALRIATAAAMLASASSASSAGAVGRPAAGRASAAMPHSRPASWLPRGLFTATRRGDAELVLDNGHIRVAAHPGTGGVLSLRRPVDRGNRISQQLAIRTAPRAPAATAGWPPPDDRAATTRMVADAVARESAAADSAIVARGRLVAPDGQTAARFEQRLEVVPGLPLVLVDIDVRLDRPLSGPPLENHVAARFAWHENHDVEIRRSLHTQAIATERWRFTAPHFIEVAPVASRSAAGSDAVTILTGGLPWHLLSSPHVLDSILAGASAEPIVRRMAVGIGLERPWDAALALLAGSVPAAGSAGLPDNVRLTVHDTRRTGDTLAAARVGLLESAGRSGEVRVDWGREVARARAVDFAGTPRDDVAVMIDGPCTVVGLERYGWLHFDLEFAG